MANTLITPKGLGVIAKDAIASLQPNLVAAATMYRGVDSEFRSKGDTANIRKPSVLTAQEFNGTAVSYQDLSESTVAVTLDKLLTVDAKITSKEASLDLEDFRAQVTVPAMQALARKIDALAIDTAYKGTYLYAGAATTTPDGLDDIAACDRILNLQNVPMDGDRYMMIDPYTREKFLQLSSVFDASVVGDNGSALRTAAIGQKLGFGIFMSQHLPSHTKGTTTAGNASGAAGATAITIAGGTASGTFVVGDLLTIATLGGSFVVTAATTLSAGAGTVSIYPPLPSTISSQAITMIGSHKTNLAYHRTAFCIASAPLSPAMGGVLTGSETYDGFSIRVTFGYDQDAKTNKMSFDMLMGTKVISPERAVRLLG